MIVYEIKGNGLKAMTEAVKELADPTKAQKVYVIALNRAAQKTHTVVKRTVAKQMGVTQQAVVRHGGLKVTKAFAGQLIATIDASGRFLPVKDFKPRQLKAGVSANPWGQRQVFAGTWLNSGRSAFHGIGPATQAAAGGHVFKATHKFNKKSGRFNAISPLWGPAVPVELVKRETAAAFDRIGNKEIEVEALRAIAAITKGFIK